MQLHPPDIRYKDSFIAAAREYQTIDSPYRRDIYELNVEELQSDFEAYLELLFAQERGERLPAGRVATSTFWLIDNDEVVGRVSIRHTLTEELHSLGGHIGYDIRPSRRRQGYGRDILRLALAEAARLGITRALLICDETNTGSKKIIEANGGKLHDRRELGDEHVVKLRYWIETTLT